MFCNIKQFVLFRRGKLIQTQTKKTTHRILFLKEKKTSHLQKQNATKKTKQKKSYIKKIKKKKKKCNAGQPQVPGRGQKVSRLGKLMMKLAGLGLSSTSCLQV